MADVGRPTKYKEEFCEMARKLCMNGATNDKLAEFFNVVTSTIDLWISTHEAFSGAVKAGRRDSVLDTTMSLHKRANGFVGPDGKYYPPHVSAIRWYLSNRDPENWKEKSELEVTGNVDEINERILAARKKREESE